MIERKKLWIIVHESYEGKVAVQAFDGDPKESFDNLNGKPGDTPSRATLTAYDFEAGTSESWSKDLPVKLPKPEDRPDAWRLGEGPVFFKKEEDEDKKEE